MAYAKTYYVVVNTNKALTAGETTKKAPFRMLQSMRNLLGDAGGARGALVSVYRDSDGPPASGTLTLSAASGAVGGTIAGTLVTVTAAGGDSPTATALAAAINANATIGNNLKVVATAAGAIVTIKAVTFPPDNTLGNAFTLVASGTGVTASGATLAGGVAATANTYSF